MRAKRLLLPLLLGALPALGQDALRPRHNSTFVPDDDEELRSLLLQAGQAAEAGDAAAAADRLHAILLRDRPVLVAVRRRELFVDARRWAQLTLLAEQPPYGPEVLAAWREAHDRQASALLQGANEGDSASAEEATGYAFGEVKLVPHVRAILERARREHNDRLEQLAERFLRKAGIEVD